ncbi:hypothetical protein UA45_20100, partial [Morganella morganii]
VLFAEGARALADARFHLILNRELIAKVSIGLESRLMKKHERQEIEQIRNNARRNARQQMAGRSARINTRSKKSHD